MSEGARATWRDEVPPPPIPRPGLLGWVLIALRGTGIVTVLLLGVLLIIPIRFAERLFTGPRRPVTGPWVQGVCRICLWIMGLRWRREGVPMRGPGAVVANHSSWLDIFVLNAAMPVFFVSKSEVASWPGINILTRVTDTHFVTRDPKLAREQAEEFAARTRAGHRLLFFPEGTSTDAIRILPFKSTLFAAFYSHGLDRILHIQPVTVVYRAPVGEDPRFYGWWGEMDFASHLLQVLAVRRQGRVEVIFHPEVPVDAFASRKELAGYCERVIRASHLFAEG